LANFFQDFLPSETTPIGSHIREDLGYKVVDLFLVEWLGPLAEVYRKRLIELDSITTRQASVDLVEGPEKHRKSCTSVSIYLAELHSFEEPSVTIGLEAFNAQCVDDFRNIDRTLGRVVSRRLVHEGR